MTTSRWTRVRRAFRDRVAHLARPTRPAPDRTVPDRTVLPDHREPVQLEYAPAPDGDADPGEIVWAWVPFEDDPSKGKDRPALVIGRASADLLALMLTSKDHSRDAALEARHGRVWMDIGTGAWDSRRRPSEVRLDRVLRLHPSAVRREGARVDRQLFDTVAVALRRAQGW
ncbi:type II toxin-antitoxin system PemK/MazF family toxin [Cellulomonas fengjieae]|uniref:type II toxin-antitoxin system PemK/MazF family toxin n=1 Tax=Cellulomonas fengjieae TaxID=2819978 RepID=UPI001AAFB8BA|nr:type II toxin-antitoxin system PemK/MazF family toxin [Cellulomonas fengjieae]MBO3101263.1 type II toxin-antitoxin system PemK/MazF family toxin [Cellulomonas fengjieae]